IATLQQLLVLLAVLFRLRDLVALLRDLRAELVRRRPARSELDRMVHVLERVSRVAAEPERLPAAEESVRESLALPVAAVDGSAGAEGRGGVLREDRGVELGRGLGVELGREVLRLLLDLERADELVLGVGRVAALAKDLGLEHVGEGARDLGVRAHGRVDRL